MFKNVNPNFSMSRFIAYMVVVVGLISLYVYVPRNKAFSKWLATADFTWLVITILILAVFGLIAWAIESGNRRFTYGAVGLAAVAALVIGLNSAAIAAAFANWLVSLTILAFIAVLAVIGFWIASTPRKKASKSDTTTTPEGGA